MDPLWKGVLVTSGAGAVIGIISYILKALIARDRAREAKIKELEQAKESEESKLLKDVIEELRSTKIVMLKLDLRMEMVEKVIPTVEKHKGDLITLFERVRGLENGGSDVES